MDYFKPFCCVYILTLFILSVQAENTVPDCEDGNDSEDVCCPIVQSKCPDNYQLVTKQVSCPADSNNNTNTSTSSTPNEMTSPTTLTTSRNLVTTENATSAPDSDVTNGNYSERNDSQENAKVCEKCLKTEHFNNGTKKCDKCDPRCLTCEKSDLKNCTVCYIEHDGSCYSECPQGTNPSNRTSKTGSWLCEAAEEQDNALPVGIIAGASVGGVVLIAAVIVTIVCCCRRQGRCHGDNGTSKETQRTAMSLIIETNQSTGNTIERGDNKVKTGKKNYENMNTVLPGQKEILNQADIVTRYTVDPTSEPGRKVMAKPRDTESEAEYANSAMVKLAQTTDLTSTDPKRLEDKLDAVEIDELGVAPTAPGQPGPSAPAIPVPTAVTKRKKPNLVKRLSQRMIKLKKAKSKEAPYIDMTPMRTESGLSDYENFEHGKKDEKMVTQSKNEEQTGAESEMEIYENYDVNQSSGEERVDSEELENYENIKDVLGKSMVVDTSEHSTVAPVAPDSEVLEDYENVSSLEPYENMTFKR